MNGIDIVRRVYRRLRMPSQTALPWQTALETVSEVIARKKLDLALSQQNSLAVTSDWFTPSSADFPFEDEGLDDVLLPIRVETRGIGSDYETGENVPIVNFEVLDTSNVGAIAFYGEPLRMVFRDSAEYIGEREYRIVYEPDFDDSNSLESVVGLPAYFKAMVVLESAYRLLDQVEDDSPAWMEFMRGTQGRWEGQIADDRDTWATYVKRFKGKAQVPKRTFFQNRSIYQTRPRFRG